MEDRGYHDGSNSLGDRGSGGSGSGVSGDRAIRVDDIRWPE